MTTLNNIRSMHDDECDIDAENVPHSIARDEHTMKDVLNYIGDLFSRLTSDLGELFSLHMDLFKAEMRDAAKTLARDSAMLIVAIALAGVAFGGFTLALAALVAAFLPIANGFLAFAAGTAIVGAVYLLIAGILAFAGINHLRKRSLAPDRTIQEVQRHKQAVKEIR